MKHFLLILLAAFVLCTAAAPPAHATDYGSAAAYTYRDGFFWSNGVAYTRQAIRCWNSPTGWCWKYFRADYVTPSTTGTQYLTSTTENWRSKLLDIAATRDRYENAARASALEHNEFLEALDALGMKGNFALNGYGYAPQYAQPFRGAAGFSAGQQLGYVPNAEQGSTVYGYTELSQVVGKPVDLSAQLAKIERLADRAIDLTDKTMGGHQQLVSDIGQNQARVAEIVTKAQATAQLIQQLQPTPVETRTRTEFRTEQGSTPAVGGIGPGQPQPPRPQAASAAVLSAVIESRCLSCHSPEKPTAGVDMTKYASFTAEQKEVVRSRLIDPDPLKRMPLAGDKQPGKALTWTEILPFTRE